MLYQLLFEKYWRPEYSEGQAGTISGKEWRRQGEAQGETFLGILEEQQDTSLGRAFNFPKIP